MANPNPKPVVSPDDLPLPAQTDWDALAGDEAELTVEDVEGVEGFADESGQGLESLEEEDDNPYGESDELLQDDREEHAMEQFIEREAGDPV